MRSKDVVSCYGYERVLQHFCLSSSQSAAYGFHRTAYKERLEEVKYGLRVIETLREYKPRTRYHNRSGGGHGAFNLGYPFSEKDSNYHQRGDGISQCYDGGNDADAEDNKGKGRQRPTGSRASIQARNFALESHDLEDSKPPTSHQPSNPSHDKQDILHEYPPPRKRAVDQPREEYNPAIQAARVIKSAVLHDARNIKRNDEDLSGLRFSVNSAHEAKV